MAAQAHDHVLVAAFSLRLCTLLRQRGVDVGIQQSIACSRAIELLNSPDEGDLLRVYRTTLINRKQDLWRLRAAYAQLLKEQQAEAGEEEGPGERTERHLEAVERSRVMRGRSPEPEGAEDAYTQGYSAREIDNHKDFRFIGKEEFPAAMAELERMARRRAVISRRKTRRARRRGRPDLRSSIRESVKCDGEILRWRFKRRKPTHSRLIVLADVSGSMEVYSTFFLRFIHLLHRCRNFKLETFVFSTRLERLTRQFRRRDFLDMLAEVSREFSAWSGGTKIGAAIADLNGDYSTAIARNAIVLIMSDGWDTGDIELLKREMSRLRNHTQSVIWINPLKGDPSYEPLAAGMAAALPYCDQFVSGHSLESMEALAGLLNV